MSSLEVLWAHRPVRGIRDMQAHCSCGAAGPQDETWFITHQAEALDAAAAPQASSVRVLTDILEAHQMVGATCRCGFSPRLDWYRQHRHVAEVLAAAGVGADSSVAAVSDANARWLQRLAQRLLDGELAGALDVLGRLADGSLRPGGRP